MKKKRIKKYACLKVKQKHFKDRQAAYLLSDTKHIILDKLIMDNSLYELSKKIQWSTVEEIVKKMRQKLTYQEYEERFLGKFTYVDEPKDDNDSKTSL